MSVFSIGDLHLPGHDLKPMDVFGSHWDHHFETISTAWREMITDEDLVLIPGDISWAMYLKDALDDLRMIDELPGQKVILRGNHDYWWSSLSQLRSVLPPKMKAIQNDALLISGHVVCGTRGWQYPVEGQAFSDQDQKIWSRELIRLRMSLDAAVKIGNTDLIVMLHFPPLPCDGSDTEMTRILSEYPVKHVLYGHLHGNGIRNAFNGEKDGMKYRLVSCDSLNFSPVKITE